MMNIRIALLFSVMFLGGVAAQSDQFTGDSAALNGDSAGVTQATVGDRAFAGTGGVTTGADGKPICPCMLHPELGYNSSLKGSANSGTDSNGKPIAR